MDCRWAAGLRPQRGSRRRTSSRGRHRLGALEAPGVDADAALHHATYADELGRAGCDRELAAELYRIESDWSANPFAQDAAAVLFGLHVAGVALAVVSDIHFDLRPAFAAAGLGSVVDCFALSYELGVQKPDHRIFEHALNALDVAPAQALMVGDRASHDGAAADLGISTLLLPGFERVDDRRLHLVSRLMAETGLVQ